MQHRELPRNIKINAYLFNDVMLTKRVEAADDVNSTLHEKNLPWIEFLINDIKHSQPHQIYFYVNSTDHRIKQSQVNAYSKMMEAIKDYLSDHFAENTDLTFNIIIDDIIAHPYTQPMPEYLTLLKFRQPGDSKKCLGHIHLHVFHGDEVAALDWKSPCYPVVAYPVYCIEHLFDGETFNPNVTTTAIKPRDDLLNKFKEPACDNLSIRSCNNLDPDSPLATPIMWARNDLSTSYSSNAASEQTDFHEEKGKYRALASSTEGDPDEESSDYDSESDDSQKYTPLIQPRVINTIVHTSDDLALNWVMQLLTLKQWEQLGYSFRNHIPKGVTKLIHAAGHNQLTWEKCKEIANLHHPKNKIRLFSTQNDITQKFYDHLLKAATSPDTEAREDEIQAFTEAFLTEFHDPNRAKFSNPTLLCESDIAILCSILDIATSEINSVVEARLQSQTVAAAPQIG